LVDPDISFSDYYRSLDYQCFDFSGADISLSDYMKFIKSINQHFVILVLIIVYYLGIGISYLFFFFFAKKSKKTNSYWQPVNNLVDFNSEY